MNPNSFPELIPAPQPKPAKVPNPPRDISGLPVRTEIDAPYCIQIELSEGCNLQCNFCGIQGIREKQGGPFKFMTVELAELIATQIRDSGWNPRIEFAMHGEPTMNQDIVEIMRVFRKHLPKHQLMITSNGGGLLAKTREKLIGLFESVNVIALDNYDHAKIVPKVLERAGEIDFAQLYHYPQDGLQHSPHKRWKAGTKVLIVVQDISTAEAGTHSTLTNHCGCGSPYNDSKANQRCAKPFREIGIRWDGNIAGCCNDWRGIYKVGNVQDASLVELWHGERFEAMRQKLYYGQRDFGACRGCDYVSYRNGLLPDKFGKTRMAEVTEQTEAIVREACGGGTYTTPVLRPWETKK